MWVRRSTLAALFVTVTATVAACASAGTASLGGGGDGAGQAGGAASTSGAEGGGSGNEQPGGNGGSVSGGAGGSGQVVSNGGMTAIDSSCGYAQNKTLLEPGAILIVFDQSSSMEEDVQGKKAGDNGFDASSVKWQVTTKAVQNMLSKLSPDANVGLLLFPNAMIQPPDYCMVAPTPQVPIGKLSTTGGAIDGYLSAGGPGGPGGVTPLAQALIAGHSHIDTLTDIKGQRAVLLVTDGAPSALCGMANNELIAVAADAYGDRGYRTFVVGLAGSANELLSGTAAAGQTSRMPDCLPKCGFDPANPFADNSAKCCHYVADGADAATKLADALAEVAGKFQTTCVFAVPKGDPSKFDPNLVNVLVSIEGGAAQLVPKSADNGWSYVGNGTDQLEIKGALCSEILTKSNNVEVLLGCPTGQIK